jgi:hypothetical protein
LEHNEKEAIMTKGRKWATAATMARKVKNPTNPVYHASTCPSTLKTATGWFSDLLVEAADAACLAGRVMTANSLLVLVLQAAQPEHCIIRFNKQTRRSA